jgi:hypothetical protein
VYVFCREKRLVFGEDFVAGIYGFVNTWNSFLKFPFWHLNIDLPVKRGVDVEELKVSSGVSNITAAFAEQTEDLTQMA